MNNGWIKVPRNLMSEKLWLNAERLKFYLMLLMMVNHEAADIYGEHLEPGQLLTSRDKLEEKYNCRNSRRNKNYVTANTIYSWLRWLKDNNLIGLKTSNEYTVITVFNWNLDLNEKAKLNTDSTSVQHQLNIGSTSVQHKQELRELENLENKEKDNVARQSNDQLNGQVLEIILYLNSQTGKHFKAKSKDTVKLVQARIHEGYTLEDFKTVVDNKASSWLNDSKMNKFLRPSTLFKADKFENYLNEGPVRSTKKSVETLPNWAKDDYKPDESAKQTLSDDELNELDQQLAEIEARNAKKEG